MSIEEEIEQLRQELPRVYSNPPHILSIKENEEISILAADRPDKAVVIGPGGYIAGHLAKSHGKSLSISAYTDNLIRDFRKSESERLLTTIKVTNEQKKILQLLKDLLNQKETSSKKPVRIAVAMSGGRDSLATTILLHDIFQVKGFTVYPSDIILPSHVRDSIKVSVQKLSIDHQYITADFTDIVERALAGRIHPCGQCHQETARILIKECAAQKIPALAFGELLPTGSQSLRIVDGVLIINLPAFLALTKRDTTEIASCIQEYPSLSIKCPLLKQVHRNYPAMRYPTAKRLFREVRAGVLEPGEALQYLKPLM